MAPPPNESREAYNARMTAEATAAWYRAHPTVGTAMPTVSQMIISKYIGQQDLPGPQIVTIRAVSLDTVGRGNEAEQKWLMWFNEVKKALKLNNTTLRYLESTLGPNSDAWLGQRVQLYVDPSVTFAGRVVGGVRLRVGRNRVVGATGALYGPGGASAPSAGARFDPMTGQPLQPQVPAGPAPRFDPMTGRPLPGPTAPPPPDAEFDANTGQVHPNAPGSGIDPEFDDDIPF